MCQPSRMDVRAGHYATTLTHVHACPRVDSCASRILPEYGKTRPWGRTRLARTTRQRLPALHVRRGSNSQPPDSVAQSLPMACTVPAGSTPLQNPAAVVRNMSLHWRSPHGCARYCQGRRRGRWTPASLQAAGDHPAGTTFRRAGHGSGWVGGLGNLRGPAGPTTLSGQHQSINKRTLRRRQTAAHARNKQQQTSLDAPSWSAILGWDARVCHAPQSKSRHSVQLPPADPVWLYRSPKLPSC